MSLAVSLDRAWERFRANVEAGDDAACWPWQGYRYNTGYGGTEFSGAPITAHRLSWILHNGSIPEGLFVLHSCDNPPCVNPKHLFLGTQQDNIADMRAKGRGVNPPARVGDQNHKATLTKAQVDELRRLAESDQFTQRQLAAQFGVSQSTAWRLIHRHTRAVA